MCRSVSPCPFLPHAVRADPHADASCEGGKIQSALQRIHDRLRHRLTHGGSVPCSPISMVTSLWSDQPVPGGMPLSAQGSLSPGSQHSQVSFTRPHLVNPWTCSPLKTPNFRISSQDASVWRSASGCQKISDSLRVQCTLEYTQHVAA